MREKLLNKKIIILLSVLLVLILSAVGYLLFKKSNDNDYNNKNIISNWVINEFNVKQVYPSNSGYTVLFNDGTVSIYYINDDKFYSTQVYDICAINELIDANRGISKNGDVYIWSTDIQVNGIAQAAQINGLKNIVAASGDYYVRKNNDNNYTVLMLNSNVEGALIEDVFELSSFKKIVIDDLCGYILKDDGTVWSWGNNVEGQLGNGSVCNLQSDTHYIDDNCKCSKDLIQVNGLNNIVDISIRIAVDSDGKVYTWGNNYFGVIGNGVNCQVDYDEHYVSEDCTCAITPYCISNIGIASYVFSNGSQSYAVCEDGVYSWGKNNPSFENDKLNINAVPSKYNDLNNITYISGVSGYNDTTIFVSKENGIYIVGYNNIDNSYNAEPKLLEILYPIIFIDDTVTDTPENIEIYAGENIKFPDIQEVECKLSNGETVKLKINGWYSNSDNSNTFLNGEYIYYPSFTTNNYYIKDKSIFEFKVTVSNEMPKSIDIILPSKTEYYVDEKIDLSDGKIRATYFDGKVIEIPLLSADLYYDDLSVGDNEINVSAFGLQKSFNIKINDKIILSVSLNTLPDKTVYNIGESVDTSGGTLLIAYSNDEIECIDIDDSMIRNFDTSKKGIVSVIIDYMDYTFSYDINVVSTVG